MMNIFFYTLFFLSSQIPSLNYYNYTYYNNNKSLISFFHTLIRKSGFREWLKYYGIIQWKDFSLFFTDRIKYYNMFIGTETFNILIYLVWFIFSSSFSILRLLLI